MYVAGWVVTGATVAVAVLALLRGPGDDDVTLPPVREIELTRAVQRAGCELRGGSGQPGDDPVVDGPRSPAARPGFYDAPLPTPALVGAMRRGTVIISYRPGVVEERREELRTVQRAVPRGTIVVPNERMRFAVAITAWRQRLGCRRIGDETRDALRLFRGRYVGSGPDSPP